MKSRIGLLGVVLSAFVFAADRDTIPLSRQTSPPTGSSMILPQKKAPTTTSENGGKVEPIIPGTGPSSEAAEKPYVASLEVYGSPRINEVILRETLGKDLTTWLQKGIEGDPDSVTLENQLADRIKKKFGFPLAEWSVIQYFEPGDLAIHITLDVVEKEDVAKRMAFQPAPTGEFKDPGGLIKQWMEYEDTALELVETGQMQPEADECPAFHCPFGHKNPKLKKYEKIFVDGVNKFGKELMEIQAKDKRPEFRGAASYLLAYLKDGKKVVSAMVDRITDPEALVRNNALRVLGDIAEFHQELVIPIKPVLTALQYPRVSDRSKAVYLAYLLSLNSQDVRAELLKSSIPLLMQILASKQPDHRELSHAILRKISGKEYAATDSLAWSNWYGRLNGPTAGKREVSKK